MSAARSTNWRLWSKLILVGGGIAVGGPYLTQFLMVSEEDALKKYTPEERQKIMENKREKDAEFEVFINRLKEQSKSKQNVWTVDAQERKQREDQQREKVEAKNRTTADELAAQKEQMRKEAGLSSGSVKS